MAALLDDWLAGGRLLDAVLLLIAAEALVLVAWNRVTGGGIAPRDLAGNLAAGALLMLAVRAALTGPRWTVAPWLVLALIAHVADLARRWRRQPPGGT